MNDRHVLAWWITVYKRLTALCWWMVIAGVYNMTTRCTDTDRLIGGSSCEWRTCIGLVNHCLQMTDSAVLVNDHRRCLQHDNTLYSLPNNSATHGNTVTLDETTHWLEVNHMAFDRTKWQHTPHPPTWHGRVIKQMWYDISATMWHTV